MASGSEHTVTDTSVRKPCLKPFKHMVRQAKVGLKHAIIIAFHVLSSHFSTDNQYFFVIADLTLRSLRYLFTSTIKRYNY